MYRMVGESEAQDHPIALPFDLSSSFPLILKTPTELLVWRERRGLGNRLGFRSFIHPTKTNMVPIIHAGTLWDYES